MSLAALRLFYFSAHTINNEQNKIICACWKNKHSFFSNHCLAFDLKTVFLKTMLIKSMSLPWGNPYLLKWFNPSISVVHSLVFVTAKYNVISEACCDNGKTPKVSWLYSLSTILGTYWRSLKCQVGLLRQQLLSYLLHEDCQALGTYAVDTTHGSWTFWTVQKLSDIFLYHSKAYRLSENIGVIILHICILITHKTHTYPLTNIQSKTNTLCILIHTVYCIKFISRHSIGILSPYKVVMVKVFVNCCLLPSIISNRLKAILAFIWRCVSDYDECAQYSVVENVCIFIRLLLHYVHLLVANFVYLQSGAVWAGSV